VNIEGGKRVDEHIGLAVVEVPLDQNIRHCRLLLNFGLIVRLELDSCGAEVIRVNRYLIIIARLVSESLRDDVLFGKVKSAHWPALLALEGAHGVSVAHFHAVADIAVEHNEKFQELLPYALNVGVLIILVILAHLLEALVGAVFDVLGLVDSFFLTNWSVKID